MKQELQQKLFDKYPKLFRQKDLSMNETCMCWGIETGDGWYSLIDSLCSHLQWNIDHNNKDYVIKSRILRFIHPYITFLGWRLKGKFGYNFRMLYSRINSKWKRIYIDSERYPQIEAVQVKEKFGGLRFYTNISSNEQEAAISFAESLSYKICENCGTMQNIGQTKGWVSTLCKECAKDNKTWKEYET